MKTANRIKTANYTFYSKEKNLNHIAQNHKEHLNKHSKYGHDDKFKPAPVLG